MSIPRDHADKLLADCGRRCCICRRFKPLHLQVHHIQPREEDGNDDPENLIALCVTCHSSVHTKTSMTRNFTAAELKQHRDNTIAAVRDGRLVGYGETPAAWEATLRVILDAILSPLERPPTPMLQLMPEAIEALLTAANYEQSLLPVQYDGGWLLQCGSAQFPSDRTDKRKQAAYRRAFDQLVLNGLVEEAQGNVWSISYDGYLLADQLIAAEKPREAQSGTAP